MRVIILTLCIFLHTFSYAADITTLLPSKSCPKGWDIDGAKRVFTEDNLYDHINGEAEMYIPYGFKVMATAAYKGMAKPKNSLIVDVYQMGSRLDAFGIYSNYTRPDSPRVRLGVEGYMDKTLLMFYKDRYFVRITVLGSITREALLNCARAIERNIKGDAKHPAGLDVFKAGHIKKGSEKYIAHGLLGYKFLGKGLIAETNTKDAKVFVVTGQSEIEISALLEDYRGYLKKEGIDLKEYKGKGEIYLIGDEPLYKKVLLYHSGRYLVGIVRFEDPALALEVLEAVSGRLPLR